MTTLKKPKRCNPSQLNAVGVDWLGTPSNLSFRCQTCGCVWSPMLQTGGRLPKRYWECPEGQCNGSAT